MSDLVKAPPPVNLKTGNIQKSWDLFKQKFGFYLIAIGKTKASTEVKCALLMGVAGDDALEVYNAFADKLITYKTNEQNEQVIDTDYSNNYDKVVEQFDLYAAEKKCVTGCRELFNARSQRKGESFQTWLTDIQTLVKDCEYAQISDSMLKDRIIWGTYDKKLREAIRAKARLPLDDIIEICKGAANNARYPGQNDQGDTQEVDAVQVFSGKGTKMHPNNFGIPSSGRGGRGTKGYRGRGRGRFQQTQTRNGSKGEGKSGNNSGFNNLFKYKCRKCAKFHEAGNCPAWGQTCGKCGGRNHFKVVCQKASNKPEQAKKVDSLQSVTSQLEGVLLGGWSDNNRYVHMLTVRDTVKRKVIESGWESKRPRKEHTEVLRLQGEHYVKFKLDNGSEVNSLPIHVFEKINKGYKVYPANTLLESYGQVLSKPAGAVELLVETKYGGKLVCEFLLSTVEPKPLLGIEACEKLNLVIKVQHPQDVNSVTVSKFLPESKQDFVKEYMELFTGMGEFQQKVEIVVDPTYQPRMCPARRYHFSIIQKLKPKLDDLERTGVIAKVTDEIPKFVSNMVIREKSNGDLRICLDPEQLNKAILKPRFQPRVEYLPGKYMHIADLLSRQCLGDHVEDDPEMTEVVHEVTKYIPMSETIKADLIKETALDPGLSAVMKYCREGWPLTKNKIEPEAKPYWQIRMDIFVEDNLIILEDRIIVPVKLRKPVLKKLHTAHLGIDKTKARARQSLYWPGMSNDIANFIKECRACERHSANNYREPLIPHEIPSLRFQKVGVDILNFDSKDYLVLEDYLSKWLEVKPLPSKSSKAVIDALRSIFATHGNPQQIFGDNNPLNSSECHEFARSIECDIKTSSPEYARSNGLAEKGVHIAKQMLKKCKDDGTHILDALKEYNNTPLTGLTVSPAQILMSRACRTVIPTLKKHLEPKVVLVKALLKKLQDKVKAQHDLRARRKPVTFQQGDDVVVRRGKKWQKGKIVRRLSENRSYVINLLGGGQLRRNTWHIKHSKTKPDRVDAGGNQIVLDAEEMLANLKANDSVTRNPRNPLCNFVPAACRTVDEAQAPHTSRFGRRIIQNKKYNDQFLKF
ncbi:hypothetical protein KUF71_019040 [Frankliniella fusca]|uniref:RNA-directed DNA polymerase n=1 Tax=Frankliniella fusca TaxID=407009 RepID=A0AAE1GSW9_9NEOP|nr:hypothetical protein KUF71_019040 [Frankliniella fusca]